MFKKAIIALVLLAVFGAGYYLGKQPDTPDVFAWGRDAQVRASGLYNRLRELTADPASDDSRGEASGPLSITYAGRTYELPQPRPN